MILFLFFLALSLAGNEARADIYRYLDDEGVECFTDIPKSKDMVMIIKEKPAPPRSGVRRTTSPAHPSVATPTKAANQSSPSSQGEFGVDNDLPVRGRISSTVGLRHDPIDGVVRDHKGVDIVTPEGTPVRPVAAGVVIFSGWRQGYGNTVMIRHGDGMVTIYAHNSTNLKSVGEPVDRGSTIAFSGSTGHTTGPHLHFEAWKDGVNMTLSFFPGAASGGHLHDSNDIRRIVQADGTLRFTNLP